MKHILFDKYIKILLALLSIIIMSTFFYGIRVLILILTAIVFNVIFDKFLSLIFKIKKEKLDLSVIITPIIITLMMPANIPIYIIIVGCIIANAVAIYPFGGNGKNIFNPAAVAISFITLSWPNIISVNPIITQITSENISTIPVVSSHITTLRLGGTPQIDMFDLFLGKFTGQMGTTFVIVIITCLIFLLLTKTIPFSIIISSFTTVILGLTLFSNSITGDFNNLIYHITASSFLFCITFMACDPVTSPNKLFARIIYGVVLGILFILYQYYGATVNTFVFPLLVVNALAHTFDKHEEGYKKFFLNLFNFKKQNQNSSSIEASANSNLEGVNTNV